jgi:ubiquinone/menaquinone biosynthesis C-methylase UbiE/uncharacterized protein YbaR (Trm112 family)
MHDALAGILRCPVGCDTQLELDGEVNGGEVRTGTLHCRGCGREYRIEDGIARMLPDDLRLEQTPDRSTVPPPIQGKELIPEHETAKEATVRKRSEMRARDAQVEDYDRMWYLSLFGKVETPLTLSHLSLERTHLLLEAGCGTGRMTRAFAARCERLVSADFSWESLRACSRKLRQSGVTNVDLIQADICQLPLRSNAFDRVASCQVLEHIPTPESRATAVEELSRVLKDSGRLVLSAYQYSLLTRLFGEKEGQHEGGIYFYRFARQELQALLSRTLEVEAITGAMVYHYIARCRKHERRL